MVTIESLELISSLESANLLDFDENALLSGAMMQGLGKPRNLLRLQCQLERLRGRLILLEWTGVVHLEFCASVLLDGEAINMRHLASSLRLLGLFDLGFALGFQHRLVVLGDL